MEADADSEMECSDEEDAYDDYYNVSEGDRDVELNDPVKDDPEYFEFECLTSIDVDKLINERVEELCRLANISPMMAKVLLHMYHWKVEEVEIPARNLTINKKRLLRNPQCPVCFIPNSSEAFRGLSCNHLFCKDCWTQYCEIKVKLLFNLISLK